MKLLKSPLTIALLIVASILGSHANAQTLITATAAPSTFPFTSGNRTYETPGDLGYLFQANSDLLVTSLGQYIPTTGLATTDNVFLFHVTGTFSGNTFTTTSETQIATVQLTAGTSADASGFGYATLSVPVALVAGEDYVIDYDGSATDYFLDSQSASTSSSTDISAEFDTTDITPLASTLEDQSTTDYPDKIDAGSPFYVGPNAKFTAVTPEPASWALMFAGLAALVGLRVRSVRRA